MSKTLLILLLLRCAVVVQAQSSSSSSALAFSSSGIGTEVGDESQAVTLAQDWFEANSNENVTYLAVSVNSALSNITGSEIICGEGIPSLQRRSLHDPPNGGCPTIFTAMNGSCTCLQGYGGEETWEFLVTTRTSDSEYPLALNATSVLPIDTIRTLLVPPNVTTISIVGAGNEPQAISFVPQDVALPGSKVPIAVSATGTRDTTSITTVRLENIDLSSIVLNAGYFFPSTTLNLTLRNCNLEKFGFDFFQGLNSIEYLDLSENKLLTAYAGNSIGSTCTTQFCAVQILNLTGNELTSFPTVVFNLECLAELYLRDNNFTDFNVSASIFKSVSELRAFESDSPVKSATCSNGTWQTVHNISFCVLNESSSSEANTVDSFSTSSVVYITSAAGALVFVLVLIFLWMKCCYRPDFERLSSSSKFDSTGATFFDDTNRKVNSDLLKDPVIVTNRIEYKQVRVGKCISHGGFGLVFVGEYRGRRVAIKKIRPNNNADVSEIEVFLKEITLMAVLYHPRIVEFVGVAWDSLRHLTAVTEYMDNGDLRNVLQNFKKRGSPLSWETHKASISLHIAEALSYLHSLHPKVIHRDLKSKNVLLNLYFEAKLSDFGISRTRYDVETHMTAGVGTSFWIAPEVLLGHDYDERADIYSFGVVLAEIDTDEYPYWNDKNPNRVRGRIQEAEILSQVAAGTMRPDFSRDCPVEIFVLAEACLQKDPQHRPNAAEVVATLQDFIRPSRRSSQCSDSVADDLESIWSVQSPSNVIL